MDYKKIPILPIVAGGLGIFVTVAVLRKIGVLKSKEKKQEDKLLTNIENQADATNVFSPTAKYPKGAWLLSVSVATKLAKQIKDANHWYNDNEEQIYSVFRSLKTQSQVISLSYIFNKIYKEDLYFFLKNILSKEELATVIKLILSKPKFKKNG